MTHAQSKEQHRASDSTLSTTGRSKPESPSSDTRLAPESATSGDSGWAVKESRRKRPASTQPSIDKIKSFNEEVEQSIHNNMPNDLHLRVKFSRSELNKLYEQGAIDSNALAADTAQSTERRQIVVQAGQLEIVVGDSDVEPFVTCILDGDSMPFKDSFVEDGEAGGRRAARKFANEVRLDLRSKRVETRNLFIILLIKRKYLIIHYGRLKSGLGDKYEAFIRGFNEECEKEALGLGLVDAGDDLQGVDKAAETLHRLFLFHAPKCVKLYYTGCHDRHHKKHLKRIMSLCEKDPTGKALASLNARTILAISSEAPPKVWKRLHYKFQTATFHLTMRRTALRSLEKENSTLGERIGGRLSSTVDN